MEFKLEDKELEDAEKFIKSQRKKDNSMPTAGERWTYLFTPSGLGTVVYIKDELLGDTKNVTNWDWW
jgi:hypothetical protein